MRYRLAISEKSREQLRALPKETRRNIGQRMEALRDDLRGDVTKLKDKGSRYRLQSAAIAFSSSSPVKRFKCML